MASMKTRIITAVIALPLLVVVLFFSTKSFWVINSLLSLVTGLMTIELLTAKKLHTNLCITLPSVLFSIATPLFSFTPYFYLPLFLYILVIFIILMITDGKITYDSLTFAFTGSVVITAGISCLTYTIAVNPEYNSLFLVLSIAVPWMADAGAYFAGTFFGKHKLCPRISPKKTVEGFLGGALFSLISAILVGVIFQNLFFAGALSINYVSLLIIGVLDAFFSVVGDLSFSLIKRHCGIKDYGSIFPGHGGMLDRCDSVIFTCPLVLVVNELLPILL